MKNITKIEEEIQNYNQSLQTAENLRPKNKCCPKCKEEVSDIRMFKYHDQRKRHVKVIIEALIKIFFIILIRCKCPMCKKKFTLYPNFILPYKHYASSHMVDLCENYLKKEIRYEDAPKDKNSRIAHPETYRKKPLNEKENLSEQDKEERESEESFMAGTTIYRWISWLGSLEPSLTKALALIKQISPQTDFFRKINPVYPSKYRSSQRKSILEIAMRILQMKEVKIIEKKFFPDFAIGV